MQIRVLGPLEVTADDGTVLDLGSPLQRVLLALLLVEPGVVRSTDWLVEHLWADGAVPSAPVASLQTYVARCRRTLRDPGGLPLVERSGPGYRVVTGGHEVDAERFVTDAAAARRALRSGDAAGALGPAERGLAWWRGEHPWPELGDREVAHAAQTRLLELRVACEEDRLESLLALGRPEDAVADLEAHTASHPLRERGWVLLVRALALTGRTADALERYQRVHALLADELGMEPGPALRALHLDVLRGHTAAEPAPRPQVAPPAPVPRPSLPSAPLVGRSAQAQVLADVVEAVAADGPRFVVLEGEPGIGKTRLAEHATALAHERRMQVAWGRCHEDASVPALWPWRQVVAALGSPTRALEAEDLPSLFEQVRDELVRTAARAPVVVVLDDLHWADVASLRLLSFLTRELDGLPVVVLVTTRAGTPSEQYVRTRADLARTRGFRHVPVGPLDRAATAALVTATVGSADTDAVGRVHDRSGGNPFFALELTRLLGEPGGAGALPAGVRDVIRRRVASLPEGGRDLLHLAAVAGERLELDLLLRAAGPDQVASADATDAVLASGLLGADGRSLGFSHALVRETLLGELTEVDRRRLHARVAAARPRDVFVRAHHLVEGRPFTAGAETVEACAAAASRAESDRTHESAAQWWQRVLDVVTDDPETGPPLHRVLLRLARSLVLSGEALVGQDRLRECLELALAADDVATAVEAATVLGGSQGTWYWVEYGTHPVAIMGLLRRTLDRLGADDRAARVRVLLATAAGAHYGDPVAAAALADEAVAEARALGDPVVLAGALAGWLYCTWAVGTEPEVVRCATELLDLAPALPDAATAMLIGRLRRAQAQLVLADASACDADLRAAWELAEQLRSPLYQAQLLQLEASRALLAGELDLSDELFERARVRGERVQMHQGDLAHAASMYLLRREQGRADELALPPPTTPHVRGGELLPIGVLVQRGDLDAARELARRTEAFDPAMPWWNWEAVTCMQAELAVDLGETSGVEHVVESLTPLAGRVAMYGGIGALGPVTRFLGRLEAALGRWDAAEEHLRACLELSRGSGFVPSEAVAALTLGEVLFATGRPEEAAEHLAVAARLAEDVGMPHVTARVHALLG